MAGRSFIGNVLAGLREHYPLLVSESPDQWIRRGDAYHAKLRRFDAEAVTLACDRAARKYPDSFPTVGQLVNLCLLIDKEQREEARTNAAKEKAANYDHEIRAETKLLRETVIPDDAHGQEEWIAEGKTQFDRLARRFQCESKNLNLDPCHPPPEIARKRLDAIMLALEEHGRFGCPITPEPSARGKPEPGWDG